MLFIEAVRDGCYHFASKVLDAQLPRQQREAHAIAVNACIKGLQYLRQSLEG
jgi:hypothetical protein